LDTTIGLFGTCGASTWRNTFIEEYKSRNIKYFNPQVADGTWNPGCVVAENKHLMEDAIILFPVTYETTGQGSLAEIGFSIQAALARNPQRYFVFLIDNECKDPNASEAQVKESNRTRILVKSKLMMVARSNSGVFLVEDLDSMLRLSLQLHDNVINFANIKTSYVV